MRLPSERGNRIIFRKNTCLPPQKDLKYAVDLVRVSSRRCKYLQPGNLVDYVKNPSWHLTKPNLLSPINSFFLANGINTNFISRVER
jgi:hypothetical protein